MPANIVDKVSTISADTSVSWELGRLAGLARQILRKEIVRLDYAIITVS